ncbi:MAG: alpha/beta hydrolase [Verrucomicrobiales bacterium]
MESPIQMTNFAEARERELLQGAHSYVYARTPEGELQAHVFFPPEHSAVSSRVPAVVCFHGGLWDISAATQFVPQCHELAARGMVAVAVEYRCFQKHRTNPLDAVADARMAMGFVRENAEVLGIDVNRVVAMGAGSGAHLAASVTLSKEGDEAELAMVRPNALILFSAVTDVWKKGVGMDLFPSEKEAKQASPVHQLPQKGLPPCLLFHGRGDRVVPFEQSVRFQKMYRKKRNECELVAFSNADHAFFNFNVNQDFYRATMGSVDAFLCGLGYLEPLPEDEDY